MKKKGILKFIIIIIFLFYTMLFIAQKTGYYENKIYKKTIMTQKQMLKFEEDVAKGLPVDIKDYLPEKVDYSNPFTKSANFIARFLSNLLTDEFKKVGNFFKALFIG